MTEKQKKYLEKLGVEFVDLTKVPRNELSDDEKEFVDFIESIDGKVTELYRF